MSPIAPSIGVTSVTTGGAVVHLLVGRSPESPQVRPAERLSSFSPIGAGDGGTEVKNRWKW